MAGTIDTLKTVVSNAGGLAHSNYFDFQVPAVGLIGESCEYTVLSCSVPSRTAATGEHTPGTVTKKFVYSMIDEDVTVVFRLTNDFKVYDICMNWMERVVDPKSYKKEFKQDVAFDAKVFVKDRKLSNKKTFTLKNSFPINISQIEFSNESENQIATFAMTLTYDYFERS